MFKLLLMKIITTATWEINRDEFDHIDQMLKKHRNQQKFFSLTLACFKTSFLKLAQVQKQRNGNITP